uniref:glycoside hydrolase family 20 zincin-like fold domain-containing protein n=1 Tax=Petrimonas sp. TaxID=2023866 RepID=UPI0033332F88
MNNVQLTDLHTPPRRRKPITFWATSNTNKQIVGSNPFLLLLSLLFLSCSPVKGDCTPVIVPKPQQINFNRKENHLLFNGKVDEDCLYAVLVDSIPEATINPDEAYRLRITPDSILIEATTEKGIYWARQTLAQIVESSDGNSVPA